MFALATNMVKKGFGFSDAKGEIDGILWLEIHIL
jgi:hypothetical protein